MKDSGKGIGESLAPLRSLRKMLSSPKGYTIWFSYEEIFEFPFYKVLPHFIYAAFCDGFVKFVFSILELVLSRPLCAAYSLHTSISINMACIFHSYCHCRNKDNFLFNLNLN